MSPQNKYDGFFDKKNIPNMENFKPTPTQIIEALMALVGAHQYFYEDEGMRLVVSNNVNYLTNWMVTEKQEGRNPNIHIGYAGFMMMVAQVMEMTYDEFAGEEERRRYPLHDDVADGTDDWEDEI